MKNSSCLLGSYSFYNRVKFLLIAHKIKSLKVMVRANRFKNLDFFFFLSKEEQKKIFGRVAIKAGKLEQQQFMNCF